MFYRSYKSEYIPTFENDVRNRKITLSRLCATLPYLCVLRFLIKRNRSLEFEHYLLINTMHNSKSIPVSSDEKLVLCDNQASKVLKADIYPPTDSFLQPSSSPQFRGSFFIIICRGQYSAELARWSQGLSHRFVSVI